MPRIRFPTVTALSPCPRQVVSKTYRPTSLFTASVARPTILFCKSFLFNPCGQWCDP